MSAPVRPGRAVRAVLSQCTGSDYRAGMPPTKRKTPQRTVGIDDPLWEKCQRIAKVRRETMAEVFRRSAVDYADKYGHLDPGPSDD